MATATHGTMSEFTPTKEDWTSYTERLQHYFAANDIRSSEKQRAILLTVCGAETYQLIRSLLAPTKPTEKSFSDIINVMSEHYQPTPSPIVQRYHFNSRSRKQGESVATFVAELKRLAEHCAYADALNEMLRDRLVVGINDSRIQRRLLAEPELTYKKAFELALAAEAADKNAKDLQGHRSESLHALQDSRKQQPQKLTCYRCGGNHLAPDCRFKNASYLPPMWQTRPHRQSLPKLSASEESHRKRRNTSVASRRLQSIDK